MYNELYDVWRKELESDELGSLPPDFYSGIVDYVRKLKEESRMLDRRTVKANLLDKEMQNVKRMVCEVIQARYKKLLRKASKGEQAPLELLAHEEERVYKGVLPVAEAFQNFAKDILRGHVSQVDFEQKAKRTVLRFLKDVPAIIGADMKPYGPFKAEDVASLPPENARILTRQGLAEKVETSL